MSLDLAQRHERRLPDAYDLEVAGFVTPNPAVEPRSLTDTIRNLNVPAVFLEANLAARDHLRESTDERSPGRGGAAGAGRAGGAVAFVVSGNLILGGTLAGIATAVLVAVFALGIVIISRAPGYASRTRTSTWPGR